MPDFNVVIVGAGFAGLAAALELKDIERRSDGKAFKITMLEARDRVGGRVHTIFIGDQLAEAGAEFIDAHHTQVRTLAARFNLPVEDRRPGRNPKDFEEPGFADTFYLENKLFVNLASDTEAALKMFEEEWERIGKQVTNPASEYPFGLDPGTAQKWDDTLASDWLDEIGITERNARSLIDTYLSGEYDSPDKISQLFLAHQNAVNRGIPEIDIERYHIDGGNQRLAEALANYLLFTENNVKILQRAKVTEILAASKESKYAVRYEVDGEEAEPIREVNYVILTIPFPVLYDREQKQYTVKISPSFEKTLDQAVMGLNYGSQSKVMLQYSGSFWGKMELLMTDLEFLGTVWLETPHIRPTDRLGILTTYLGGKDGTEISKKGKKEAQERVREELGKAYNTEQPTLNGATALWPAEEFTKAGYSAYGRKQMSDYWNLLRDRRAIRDDTTNNIGFYLAGEHTAEQFVGFMEGALQSGQLAAKWVQANILS